jgi:hypothetical protein
LTCKSICFYRIDINLSNIYGKKENICEKTMETLLFYPAKGHEAIIRRKFVQWLNVQNAEQKLPNQKKPGKWQAAQIKQANECN